MWAGPDLYTPLDFNAYLTRDRRLVLIFAPVSEDEPMTYTCAIRGFVMDRAEECPRCRLEVEEVAREIEAGDGRDVLNQVRDLLDGAAEDGAALD